jgi:drug/metabolite transporter (DMT)-like permease
MGEEEGDEEEESEVSADVAPGPVVFPLRQGRAMSERRAYLLLLAVIVFWAGNFPLGKLALEDLGPVTLTAGRALIAAPILLAIARVTAPLTHPLASGDYRAFVVLGLTGLVGNTTLWYIGLRQTSALNAGVLGATSPIFVALGASALLGDRVSARNWLGIALTVAAVLTTVAKGSLHVLVTFSVNRGDLIILGSQILWVTYSLYSRAAASLLPPVWVMAGANVVSALVLVPLAAVVEPWRSPLAAPLGWSVVLYCAGLVTPAHVWYYAVVRAIGPGRAAGFMNLMPFVVIALTWLLVGEAVHRYHVVGAVLAIAGVFLVTR